MTKQWESDRELFDLARRELFTAVVGDIMDTLGLQKQFLPPHIRPLHKDMVVIGRAMTVLEADVFTAQAENSANSLMGKPFGLMLEALDDLKTDEVYICTGSSPTYALWGELMSVRATRLQAAGAVLDGYSRDTNGILALNFPTFSYGSYAQDQGPRGKVIDFRVPLEIGGVKIVPGDIVFGDIDGVCIIPQEAEEDVFAKSIEKAQGEKLVRKAIESGMGAAEAFEKFGIM
ncbi:MAG: RraA family protein [Ardenticatenaceae bacterium]|nr:RraA family protein [Ardenticatenaceae bacterium]